MDEILGKPLNRVDGPLKVSGRAPYSYEHQIPNVAYAHLIMSTIAKGRITAINSSAAEQLPGVLIVMTHQNAPKLPPKQKQGKSGPTGRVVQLFQDEIVRYANQPIGVAVAETLESAVEAARLVEVRYAAEKPEVNLEKRLKTAYAPAKAGGAGDPAATQRGDVEAGISQASAKISHLYTTPFEVHNPMEPHATIAVWDKPDSLILYDATQGVFSDQERVGTLLGIPKENIRIVSPFLGGGFGSKGPVWSHVLITAMVARQLNRPVKLAVSRPQMFGMLGYRSYTHQQIAAGAKKDGTLTALRHDTIVHTSTFDEFVEEASVSARMLYATPNNSTSHRLVRSDLGTPSFMRAPGEAPGTYALECAMDELAYELKMDPIEFRLKNYAESDPQENKPWSSKSLRECYKQGAERFGWSKRKPEPRSMRQGNSLIGYGMATAVYPTRRQPSSATAALNLDGTISVDAGTQDLGTGTYTIMTQVAAETFGLPAKKVKFRLGDTIFPKTPVSGGSQTAASTGSAIYAATQALREKVIQLAVANVQSPLNGVKASDIVIKDGYLTANSSPSKRVSLADFVGHMGEGSIEAKAEARPGSEKESYSMYAFGAQFAEVHIDADLGAIKVARMVACFGAGKILNSKTARSQLMGGMIWGIGMALEEHAMLDERLGRWVNNNLAEYHVPVNADTRNIEAFWVEERDDHINPLGAKGIGEIGITGAPAAIANAVFHATGKRVRDLPITLDKLLA